MGRVRGKRRRDSSDVPVFKEATQASSAAGCKLENVLSLTDSQTWLTSQFFVSVIRDLSAVRMAPL
jgi:hypothetical protein